MKQRSHSFLAWWAPSFCRVMFCVLFTIDCAIAAEFDCQETYKNLDNTHERLMAKMADMAPSLYAIKLQSLEDDLFEAFIHCPRDAQLFALMGELQIAMGQPSLAAAYGNKAIQLDASFWRGHYVRGTGMCLSGECESGLESLRHASDLQPANTALQLNLCSVLVWNGLYQESLPVCTSVIQAGDSDLLGRAYYLRSQVFTALGDTERAADDLATAKSHGFDDVRDTLLIIKPESISPALSK